MTAMEVLGVVIWAVSAAIILTLCARYSAKITREMKAESGEGG